MRSIFWTKCGLLFIRNDEFCITNDEFGAGDEVTAAKIGRDAVVADLERTMSEMRDMEQTHRQAKASHAQAEQSWLSEQALEEQVNFV